MSVPILAFILSAATTLVSIGICIGVFKSKLHGMEIIITNMGKRFDKELEAFKNEYIKQITDRLKEFDIDQKKISQTLVRLEERIMVKRESFGRKHSVITK